MSTRICPKCDLEMKLEDNPDFDVDVCPKCGGMFLDKNELNDIATSIAGNIEHMTADDTEDEDKFPKRKCPNCKDVIMLKRELIGCSEIIFDYCPKCEGFYLDKGEDREMNKELFTLSKRNLPEEFRGTINGYFVREDRSNVIGVSNATGPFLSYADAFYVRITVYFKRPLNVGCKIYSETIPDKFIKIIGLNIKQDVIIGNPKLDGKLIIQSDKPETIKSILTQDIVSNGIINFLKHKPKLFTFSTKFEIIDECISCLGGPYADRLNYDIEEDNENVVNSLIDVANAIDKRK